MNGKFTSCVQRLQERIQPHIYLYFLIISILVQAFGAICTKYAAEIGFSSTFMGIPTVWIIYGFILGGMGLQVIFWQNALKHYPLSFAYPFRSIVSFIVLVLAYLLFQESITPFNVLGLAVVSVGIYYLSLDKEVLA